MYDSRDMVDDPKLVDLNLPQCGHDDLVSLPNALNLITEGRKRKPRVPSLVGEAAYEGIKGGSGANVQRILFWGSVLNGAPGYIYGADGLWQAGAPGSKNAGGEWGNQPWKRAYQYPGSLQIGLGKKLLEEYPWWCFQPHPEWVEPSWEKGDYIKPYAAGIPRKVRVIFLPAIGNHYRKQTGELMFIYSPQYRSLIRVCRLEKGLAYRALYFDPVTGKKTLLGKIRPDKQGRWIPPAPPNINDWVLVLENVK
jgi:hypothetical protein